MQPPRRTNSSLPAEERNSPSASGVRSPSARSTASAVQGAAGVASKGFSRGEFKLDKVV